MNEQRFQTALKVPSGNALEDLMLRSGPYTGPVKETFFIRYPAGPSLQQDHAALRAWQGPGRVFVPALKGLSPGEAERYIALYGSGQLPFRFANALWQEALTDAYAAVIEQFKKSRGRSEEAIVRNFSVKMLCWIDAYLPQLFPETGKPAQFPKFLCGGGVRLAEYLFLYLLFRLGCDVLYISDGREPQDPALLALSTPVTAQPLPYPPEAPSAVPRAPRQAQPAPAGADSRVVISMDRLRRPERHVPPPAPASPPAGPAATVRPPVQSPRTPPVSRAPVVSAAHPGRTGQRRTLEFEELARFASSVVMLKVFDQNDQCFKSGSGVIINERGYVLTNLHVVNGGRYYGILLEEETSVFYTDELIKYHQDYDLAVLRMDKRRQPIPLSIGGQKLVRGQKVVAIGSPLGLFNTVSDGIISGFRQMEKVSMIQFTAPVSHGSSGGALLDMHGELIGLITAGYDDGQNLNLAVDRESILRFVRGLL